MIIDLINKKQLKCMNKDIVQDSYSWEDVYLMKELQGYLYEERETHNYDPTKNLSEKETKNNEKIKEINKLINKYNRTFDNNKDIKNNLEQLYNEIDEELWRYNISINFEQLRFGKRILITGPGGIGKSQYIYELYNSLNDIKYKKCFLYGKYSEQITEEDWEKLINEIKTITQREKILFVIDAINEVEPEKRKIIYDLLEENIDNLRIIITCRDFSMNDREINNLVDIVDKQIPFSGVDIVDSIQKMSEECNIDLTKYEELMYDNNPLHLKMIKSVISNNRLEVSRNNSIAIGTDIYEQYIKNTTAKYNINKNKYWAETKAIIEVIVNNDIVYPTNQDIKNILKAESSDYIDIMKREGFIDIKSDLIIFRNETLEAYLIAREILKIGRAHV